MKTQLFKGSGVAIVTPMMDDGSVNYDELDRLIEFQIKNSTDAIVICGTTGEASTLNDSEHMDVIGRCVKTVNGRVPVVAGTGANDTRHAIELSKGAQQCGADGLLQVTPYYNKTSQRGLIRHFTAVADSTDLPVILYNVPSRTGMTIAVDTYVELAKHPKICATKEASSDISHITNVVAACGDNLALYSGNDDQVVPLMSLGGYGVISVLANIVPQEMHDLCSLYFEGKTKESLDIQLKYMRLNNAMFCDVNPIPVKAALNMMGYAAGPCRGPLADLGDAEKARVQAELKAVGLI